MDTVIIYKKKKIIIKILNVINYNFVFLFTFLYAIWFETINWALLLKLLFIISLSFIQKINSAGVANLNGEDIKRILLNWKSNSTLNILIDFAGFTLYVYSVYTTTSITLEGIYEEIIWYNIK